MPTHNLSAVTPKGSLYILELAEPFERLEFQEVPAEIPWDRTGNYAEIAVPGRNNPLHHYTGGSDSVSLKLQFVADDSGVDSVERDVRWLQSLVGNDSYNAPTRRVKIVFGKLFRNETWIVKSVKSSFTDFHSEKGYASRRTTVDISFALDTDKNRSLADMR